MIRWIRAHFDGKVIVPDEPVDWPIGAPVNVHVYDAAMVEKPPTPEEIQRRLEALERWSGCISAPPPPLESLRRENLYDERL